MLDENVIGKLKKATISKDGAFRGFNVEGKWVLEGITVLKKNMEKLAFPWHVFLDKDNPEGLKGKSRRNGL